MDAIQGIGGRYSDNSGTLLQQRIKKDKKTERKEPEQAVAATGAAEESRESFSSLRAFTDYLRERYVTVKNGVAKISQRFLRDCLSDDEKMGSLFENLKAADQMVEDAAERLPGFQSMRVTIDDEGNMTTETMSRRVGFNGEKMARRIRAARSKSDMTAIMATLQNDLAVCEDGCRDGACDETEAAKVKAMIQMAERRMAELSGVTEAPQKQPAFVDVII